MPCSSDYLKPYEREKELQRAAKLLIYARKKLGKPILKWMRDEAKTIYATDERSVVELCAVLKEMTPEQTEQVVYNARSSESRDLANWWEEHQRADAIREKLEARAARAEKLRKSGKAKLTTAERRALRV